MATSGTTAFSPDIGEIVEEAFERAGLEMKSGYDLRTARRSINLMMLEWQNRGINLWTVKSATASLAKGAEEYILDSDTIAVLEMWVRTDSGVLASQSDYHLNRISRDTYSGIPNKLTQARPLQVYIDRQQNSTKAILWPVPDEDSKYVLHYYFLRRMQDTGSGSSYDPDVPDRFWPALAAGLAYQVSLKKGVEGQRVSALKQLYEEEFDRAAGEDREKAPLRFVPGGYYS